MSLLTKLKQTQRFRELSLWLLGGGKGWGRGMVREFGMDVHTMLYLKWINNMNLLYSIGNSSQCYVAAWMAEEFGGEWIHAYV